MNRDSEVKSSNKDNSARTQTNKQTLFSLFEINVIRYSLFVENIRPEHIDPFFMLDFMSLPVNYFLGMLARNMKSFYSATVLIIYMRPSLVVKYYLKIVAQQMRNRI